jgi:hypothetical protein
MAVITVVRAGSPRYILGRVHTVLRRRRPLAEDLLRIHAESGGCRRIGLLWR